MEPFITPNVLVTETIYQSNPNKKRFIKFGLVIILIICGSLFLYKNQAKLPFLKNLAHRSSQLNPTPSPTSISTLTTKKINIVKKTGEFVINDPKPNPNSSPPPSQNQVLIEGIYDKSNSKVTIKSSLQLSSLEVHEPPPLQSTPVLKLELSSNNRVFFQTIAPINSSANTKLIPFRAHLPYYYKNSRLMINDQNGKNLLTQQINL